MHVEEARQRFTAFEAVDRESGHRIHVVSDHDTGRLRVAVSASKKASADAYRVKERLDITL